MAASLLAADGPYRKVQVPADNLSYLPKRYAFLADTMQSGARWRGFHGQPEKMRGVEPMHGW